MKKYNNCKKCIHETVCQKWFKELETAEECYSGHEQVYISIYKRHVLNGDSCEHFKSL